LPSRTLRRNEREVPLEELQVVKPEALSRFQIHSGSDGRTTKVICRENASGTGLPSLALPVGELVPEIEHLDRSDSGIAIVVPAYFQYFRRCCSDFETQRYGWRFFLDWPQGRGTVRADQQAIG